MAAGQHQGGLKKDFSDAIAWRAAGETHQQIAERLGTTYQAVRVALRRRGIDTSRKVKGMPPPQVTDWSDAIARHFRGETLRQIAAHFGVSHITVMNGLKARGVNTSHRPPKPVPTVEIACEYCGMLFSAPKRKRKRKYCSKKCSGATKSKFDFAAAHIDREAGLSYAEIAAKHGVHASTVAFRFRSAATLEKAQQSGG